MSRSSAAKLITVLLLLSGLRADCFAQSIEQIIDSGQLLKKAEERRLSVHPEWRRLLHFAPHNLGLANKSEVDDDQFFLSPNGKEDAQAELDATIRALFSAKTGDEAERCRFIGRKRWLEQQLDFKLPEDDCLRYRKWIDSLNPERVTLILPAAYLNNPASMFGHTFLRVDPKGQGRSERLLSYGINYAANTVDQQGVLYAFKGIFGGYQGYFSILPYYVQVKDYSDLENRDIWEYELALTEPEVRRLLDHLWELRGIASDYYFFDENCSYHLLDLLEVARPNLNLKQKFIGPVIPSDTVRAVLENTGLLVHTEFRPSLRSVIAERSAGLSAEERRQAVMLATGDPQSFHAARSSVVNPKTIDTAQDYASFLWFSKPEREAFFKERTYQLTALRSTLPNPAPAPPPALPPRPEQGHRTARTSLGGGFDEGDAYAQLEFRASYHDLLDPEPGYTKGAQIQLLNAALRLTDDQLQVERVEVVDILSLGFRNEFFRPISWSVSSGLERLRIRNGHDDLTGYLRVGGGLAYAPAPYLQFALLAGPSLSISGVFEQSAAIGLGPQALAVLDLSDADRLLFSVRATQHLFRDRWLASEFRAALRHTVDVNWAAELSAVRQLNDSSSGDFNRSVTEVQVLLRRYF